MLYENYYIILFDMLELIYYGTDGFQSLHISDVRENNSVWKAWVCHMFHCWRGTISTWYQVLSSSSNWFLKPMWELRGLIVNYHIHLTFTNVRYDLFFSIQIIFKSQQFDRNDQITILIWKYHNQCTYNTIFITLLLLAPHLQNWATSL